MFLENIEKYNFFFLPIEKKVEKIDNDGNESVVITSYQIKFIGSSIFIGTSLSNLINNLPERIHKMK